MSTVAGLSREQVAKQVDGYMTTHPVEDAEMTGIRQPLMDLKNRCGGLAEPLTTPKLTGTDRDISR